MLAADGVHATGVDAIGARTGVTKRTLYQHFPGKDALVAEALADRSAEWRGGFEAAISRGANDPAGQLLAMLRPHRHRRPRAGCADRLHLG